MTEGRKDDQEKPRYDLIDSDAMDELAKVLTFGAKKYASHNWRNGIGYGRLIAAALRHLFAFLRGEDNDPETGLPHPAHAMCCCMFLVWHLKHKQSYDDRYDDRGPIVKVVPKPIPPMDATHAAWENYFKELESYNAIQSET